MSYERALCFVCDKTFDTEGKLVYHLTGHTRKEMINRLKKYRMYYN